MIACVCREFKSGLGPEFKSDLHSLRVQAVDRSDDGIAVANCQHQFFAATGER